MISKFDTNIQSDELTAADLYNAQAEWEAEQYEAELSDFDPHRDFYAEMDEDDPYDGEMWEDAYDDDPADMYVWDSDLHNEF